ncbi:hypothetical protein X798_07580 [Onchocerca flexuosa]|uniref:Uncharacterized protein n=1 Tax=Onchocerca flexuosa TaxID=387005 RepID=A0A238BLA3_9BILA|nr:hypothetical protein X798_07580 [Onchocerca flexuosa]
MTKQITKQIERCGKSPTSCSFSYDSKKYLAKYGSFLSLVMTMSGAQNGIRSYSEIDTKEINEEILRDQLHPKLIEEVSRKWIQKKLPLKQSGINYIQN